MRRFLLIASFSLGAAGAYAQQLPAQTIAPVWHISELSGNAAIVIFKKDSARVQKDTAILAFAIASQPGAVRLKQKRVDTQVLRLLGLTAEAVNQQYGPDKQDLLPTEKLLTAAQQLPEKKLLLEGNDTAHPAYVPEDSAAEPELATEEPVTGSRGALDQNNPWLYAAGALVLGFLLGWLLKPRRKVVAAEPVPEALTPATNHTAWEAQLAHLQEQLKLGQQELNRLRTEDQRYFNAVFEQLLLPLQESLEQNKNSNLLAQLITAAALLNSLTRHKLGKKGKFDEANLNLLTGQTSDTQVAPVITGATPPDQIPHHLRGLILLLKTNGISGLGDLVVSGYRIKDL